ncbi:MAG TPA: DUF2934 domain-containing protein [Terriglobales bacterium]|jgi:hypothetical protein|nr:DUF2934 domain-containing protein [Terriglobales bacterium]
MARPKTPRTTPKKNGNAAELQVAAEVKKNIVPINLEDEIRRRAYEIYEARGRTPGNQHDDWLRAEREVLARYQQSA